ITWDAGVAGEAGGEPAHWRGPRRQVLAAHPEDIEIDTAAIPAWVTARQISALDRRAMPVIKQTLEADANPRPGAPATDVRLRLIELTEMRRTEVRSLALRSCAQIGAYSPLVKAIDQADQK